MLIFRHFRAGDSVDFDPEVSIAKLDSRLRGIDGDQAFYDAIKTDYKTIVGDLKKVVTGVKECYMTETVAITREGQ